MLKALLLRKKIDERKKALNALNAVDFDKRAKELEMSINEVTEETSKEERDALEEAVTAFEDEKAEHDEKKSALEKEISELEGELAEEEAKQDTEKEGQDPEEEHKEAEERKDDRKMMRRKIDESFVKREDVKAYLGEIRAAMKEKRAINNVGLTIPEVMIGLLRENIMDYSKLYRHVNVKPIKGEGRQLVQGTVSEAIWTDCCANLNELTLGFNDLEMDCYKVGGFFAICNANIEDSDVDLANELMTALGQAIAIALDKAILYGRNASTTMKMPQGIVSRLVQTEEPAGYPPTARTWADLHTTNVKSIAASVKGADMIAAIVEAFGAAKGKYSRGEKVWVMNEFTYTSLMASTITTTADGRIVAGVSDVMPVIGGIIEVLDFIPDNVIVAGYFDLYTLSERAGNKFAQSEHVRFLQDQTVFKGTARYDGAPAIAEAFVAIGIKGATPTAAMTFATDTANAGN